MLYAIVLLKRTASCGTTPKKPLKLALVKFLISIPSIVIFPLVGSKNLIKSLVIVVFPEPDLPTNAILSPFLIFKLRFLTAFLVPP